MLYAVCPTCKKLLGDKQIIYETEIEKIMNDNKLSDEEKDSKKQELAKKLTTRYCCRMRLISYVDFAKLVIQ
jgi:DNA-directed RNA polymerase subunit N (RpoN/RPB10)